MSVIKSALTWLCLIAVAGAISGCAERLPTSATPDTLLVIQGIVKSGNQSVQAELAFSWPDGSAEYINTDESGRFSLTTSKGRPISLVAVSAGRSGYLPISEALDLKSLVVQVIAGEATVHSMDKAAGELWFGVYDTDSHGDVRFRYQYSFRQFRCVTWLPWYLGYNTNPNTWTSWSLSDFPAPWSGRKLLVPTRFQWWHQVYYGWSISRALYLVAWR